MWFDVTRDRAAGAKVGISQMDWALADTGTLVQDATAIDKRLVSTLPTIHVALIATSGLRPDMPAWLGDGSAGQRRLPRHDHRPEPDRRH